MLPHHYQQHPFPVSMPTAAERQALAFLAGVALLGGTVRLWQQRQQPPGAASPVTASAESVEHQLHAIDVASESRASRTRKPRTAAAREARTRSPPRPALQDTVLFIDVDVASRQELELLPRIGPALAARIVANRDSLGPFGSLEELGRVRGVGPAMLVVLKPLVTFSGRVRQH